MRRKRIETTLKRMIKFNEFSIEYYKSYPNNIETPEEFRNENAICMGYTESYLRKKGRLYNIDSNLIEKQLKTHDEAIFYFDEREKLIKIDERKQKEKEKINLYKKAILELKKEGKL